MGLFTDVERAHATKCSECGWLSWFKAKYTDSKALHRVYACGGKQGHLSNSLEQDKYPLKQEPNKTIAAVSIQIQWCKNRHLCWVTSVWDVQAPFLSHLDKVLHYSYCHCVTVYSYRSTVFHVVNAHMLVYTWLLTNVPQCIYNIRIYHIYGNCGCAIEELSEILLICGHGNIDKWSMYTFLMAWQTKTACAADKAPLWQHDSFWSNKWKYALTI